jgi:uncharacterized membrane protein
VTSPEVSTDAKQAEGSPDRLINLIDGIYAIAMTVLVLNISVRSGLNTTQFHAEMGHVWLELGAYALSFYILANFWRDNRSLFLRVRRVDVPLTRVTLASLAAIVLLPFATSLLAEYGGQGEAVAFYAGNILAIVLLHIALVMILWRRRALQAHEINDEMGRALVEDLGATAVVFAVSIPIAFASPSAAKYFWLLLIPAKFVVGRRTRQRQAGTQPESQ